VVQELVQQTACVVLLEEIQLFQLLLHLAEVGVQEQHQVNQLLVTVVLVGVVLIMVLVERELQIKDLMAEQVVLEILAVGVVVLAKLGSLQ
jgi:hypothetical protein